MKKGVNKGKSPLYAILLKTIELGSNPTLCVDFTPLSALRGDFVVKKF